MRSYLFALFVPLWLLTSVSARAQKNHSPPPMVLYPACPCWHDIGVGDGETRIDAKVNVPAARLSVQLLDSHGAVLQSASSDVSHAGIVEVNVRVPIQAEGAYRCEARLLDENGQQIAKGFDEIHVAPRQQSRVEIGLDGFLRVGGQPYFPIGLYSAVKYPEIAQAGFMVTHNYEITTGEAADPINVNDVKRNALMEESRSNGMRMMLELPRKAIEEGQWAQIRRCIETYRHDPALLCWGSEERVARGKAPLASIAALYQIVHELDPDHPFLLGDSRDLSRNMLKDRRNFFPEADMDIGIWWWYPIPLSTNKVLLEPPSWLTTTLCKKPLWIAIQAYKTPWQNSRYPTPEEYRCMAYLSIINGVKGLFFYTGSGEHDKQGRRAGLLDQRESSHWDYMQNLVHELRLFSPVILAPPTAEKPALSPSDAPIDWATRQLGGKIYLIAANKSIRPQSAHFTAPSFNKREAQVLYEDHPVSIKGDTLTDNFAPLAVHIYELKVN